MYIHDSYIYERSIYNDRHNDVQEVRGRPTISGEPGFGIATAVKSDQRYDV